MNSRTSAARADHSSRRFAAGSSLSGFPRLWLTLLPVVLIACDSIPSGPTVESLAQNPAVDTWAAEAATLVDEHRLSLGCEPLRWHQEGAAVAEAFARQMSEEAFFGHVDPHGVGLKQRLDRAGIKGYSLAAETIAAGQDYPAKVVADWIASPGHRKILEDCGFTQIGVGFHRGVGPYREYWTAIFFAAS